jgi:hypothetical protein
MWQYYTELFKDEEQIIKHVPGWEEWVSIARQILDEPLIVTAKKTLALIEQSGTFPLNKLAAFLVIYNHHPLSTEPMMKGEDKRDFICIG